MAKKKKVFKIVKLQIPAGKANPAPPIGTALGPTGVNMMDFCKQFNAKTKGDDIIPVVITIYQDKSFTFITKKPPVPQLIKKELKLKKGSGVPNRDKVGVLTKDQLKNILNIKREDLRIESDEAGFQMIAGTARSMGIDVEL
jgi:large subunit ribosomal protein L11